MLDVHLPINKIIDSSPYHALKYNQDLWSPSSWDKSLALQQPTYTDKNQLEICLTQIKNYPALVSFQEILQLKKHIAEASKGQVFLLQAGDCAEQFKDCTQDVVSNKMNSLLELKNIIENGMNKPVVLIGRIAGQYAKPRSNEWETRDHLTLPSFKGDIIHSQEFSYEGRKTNPNNLLTAYEKSAETLKYIHHFKKTFPFFISHEALLLNYESALTRLEAGCFYASSAHMVWLGERTRHLDGAHVEYLRGIQNPIGIKLSHKISGEELVDLILTLNPLQEEGKIILIPRLGTQYVGAHLPRLIHAVKKAKLVVSWLCDPMHGNTEISLNNIKTRHFDNINYELLQTLEIHENEKSLLAGIHIETSERDVTECLGGQQNIQPDELFTNYQTACDPRLNPGQSRDLLENFLRGKKA